MNKSAEFHIKDLTKSYNKNKVLDISTLNFSSGDLVALMGKNGSGKSTMMRLLAQSEPFDSGIITYNGQSLRSLSVKLNPVTVFITEEHELPFPEPLSYWLDMHQNMYPNFDLTLFKRLSETFEINPIKSFHEMSRGQKMKALFCLQASKKPNVYLLDEITSVLDAGSRWALMEFLSQEGARGCVVIMSTNIASEMQGFATKIVFIDGGRPILNCSSASLNSQFRKVKAPKTKEFEVMSMLGARKIGLNSDETWTYMYPAQSVKDIPGVQEDRREVTISDVETYFTSGGRPS